MLITLAVPEPADVAFIHSLARSHTAGSFEGTRLVLKAGDKPVGVGLITPKDDHADLMVVSSEPQRHRLEETALALLAERALSRTKTTAVTLHRMPSRPEASRTDAQPFSQREWALDQTLSVEDFEKADAPGIAGLCRGEGWQTYAKPEVAEKGCAAPGVTTIVVKNAVTRTVAGFAQVLSDGIAQGYLAQLIVHPAYRRIGLARQLVEIVYAKSGAKRLDLLTDDAQGFYDTFIGQTKSGYRIYPGS